MANLSSNLKNILDNRLRYLPEITGQAINSIDWATRIITIGHKYGLHVDEMEEFQSVVLKSMTGLIAPENFETEIINALALSPATTEKIIAELNAQVFEPIHDYVMNGGKADEMKTVGIEITPPSLEAFATPPLSRGGSPNSDPLEIPASPEPKTLPPSIPVAPEPELKFEDYF